MNRLSWPPVGKGCWRHPPFVLLALRRAAVHGGVECGRYTGACRYTARREFLKGAAQSRGVDALSVHLPLSAPRQNAVSGSSSPSTSNPKNPILLATMQGLAAKCTTGPTKSDSFAASSDRGARRPTPAVRTFTSLRPRGIPCS